MKLQIIILLLSLFLNVTIQGQVELLEIADGFTNPVAIANADDGTNRLFVVEQSGTIKIIDDLVTGSVLPTPFLNINSLVTNGGERGLLGLAFHPDYPATPHFFVNYTFTELNQLKTKIERYAVSSDADIADPNSAFQIIEIIQPYGNHNAGDIKFGPDGYLYVTVGDGGSGEDPDDVSQDTMSLLGSLLRLDVDGDDFPLDPDANYKIPVGPGGNPFVGMPGHREEIWAIGLRNPWRIGFDRMNGDLWIADVGQYDREEVNHQPSSSSGGENYGWSCKDGTLVVNFNPCNPGPLVDPIFEYPHPEGFSITGGFVYRGTSFPNLQGLYMTVDYSTGKFWLVNSTNFGDVQSQNLINNISSFGESESGELYVAQRRSAGKVFRIFDSTICEDIVNVPDHALSEYRADIRLTSDIPVAINRNINYSSPDIELTDPFEVVSTASFEAESITCMQKIHKTNN